MPILYSLAALFIIFLAFICLRPIETESLRPSPEPSPGYEESVRRIKEKIAQDTEAADYGRTLFLTHGAKTKRAVVFYHGFTNCPRQYEQMAQKFFKAGYNVYVPRVPHHGIADRYTREIGKLTADEIIEVCGSSVDIAQDLGEKVTVLGLSMGGVMAAFDAQFRNDVELAVVLVPSFGWYFLPGVINPIVNVAYLFPNMFIWWDPAKRQNRPCPYSMYHHFATKPAGHILRLGLAVLRASRKHAPLAKRILVMTNEMDIAVDERITQNLIRNWRGRGAKVDYYQFPKSLKMEHDIIDPLHPYSKVEIVYDTILSHIESICMRA